MAKSSSKGPLVTYQEDKWYCRVCPKETVTLENGDEQAQDHLLQIPPGVAVRSFIAMHLAREHQIVPDFPNWKADPDKNEYLHMDFARGEYVTVESHHWYIGDKPIISHIRSLGASRGGGFPSGGKP